MSREIIVVRKGGSEPIERAWWQTCDLPEFRRAIEGFSSTERQTLLSEIKAAIAITSTVVNDTRAEFEHRRRARFALGIQSERRQYVITLLRMSCPQKLDVSEGAKRRQAFRTEQKHRTVVARQRLDAGDLHGAVEGLISVFESMYKDGDG